MEEGVKLPNPAGSTVLLAVSGTKNSRRLVQWGLNKFASAGRVQFRLLHVHSTIKLVSTPLRNYIPIHQVRDDIAAAYKKEIEWKTQMRLQPYKKMCTEKQIEAEIMVLEADDVAEAIAKVVIENTVDRLIIGSSSNKAFLWKFKGCNLSTRITECIPSFCTVYVVAKHKSSSVHVSIPQVDDDASILKTEENTKCGNDSSSASDSFSSNSSSLKSDTKAETKFPLGRALSRQMAFNTYDHRRSCSVDSLQPYAPCRPTQHKAIYSVDHKRSFSDSLQTARMFSSTAEDTSSSNSSITDMQFSSSTVSSDEISLADNKSWNSLNLAPYNSQYCSPSMNEDEIAIELERLRTEIRNLKNMHENADGESFSASQRLNDSRLRHIEEIGKLSEMISGLDMTNKFEKEKQRHEEAGEEAICIRKCPEEEDASDGGKYKKCTWEEILAATSSLRDDYKIGIGANGTVYKGYFDHSVEAVKILHSDDGDGMEQFKQEVEVLSKVRHPHLLVLLRVCPDKGCLVYEYMENGSLDDRLQCKDNTPPLPWFCRIRIAWEVASALTCLHNAKPKPIIHRDLKPANILLNKDFCSKIGDVGVSTLIPSMDVALCTMYKDTAPVGTFLYMDPEYHRTGLVSPKQDTYALGMVILQLLTAKPPMGLAHCMETAVENGCLTDILDLEAGQWPKAEAKEMAILGLRCLEMRRKDRPDLKNDVLPVLERLKDAANKACKTVQLGLSAPPSHFMSNTKDHNR